MKIETPIIALVVSSLFFLGVFGFFTQIGNTYEEAGLIDSSIGMDLMIDNSTKSLNNAFNQINETKQEINAISGNFTKLEPSFTSVWPAINLVFRTGKLIINSVKTVNIVGSATSQALGIDPMITNGLFMVLLIIIIIGVLLILSGRSQ